MLPYESPIFFTAVGLEFLISLYKKRKLFSLDDSINSISCGIINASVKVFTKWISIIPYTYIYSNYSFPLFNPSSLWTCIFLFLGVDCGYYWMHREMHMINIGWAGHAAHHSSEYLNLTTAARQSAFGQVIGWIFYLPLALLFPPELYAIHYSINIFFQIWIHMGLVGKMHPIIELIFNTPSHHRVHHARNPEYIDKNFAGVLIIWDRMFGTFAEEKIEPVYGLVHPIRTWDVIYAQVHHLIYLYQEASKYSRLQNKIAVIFAPPGWTISEKTNSWIAPEIPPIDYTQPKYKTNIPRKITLYLLVRFVVTLHVFSVQQGNALSFVDSSLLCFYLIFCLQTYGLILNKSAYSYATEVARTATDLGLAAYFERTGQSTHFLFGLSNTWGLLFYVISVIWLVQIRKEFRSFETKQQIEPRGQKEVVGAGKQ
eukprot:Phypoly_transcript_08354.p1 GENE.Phypoly_transcript_08354~~Phypoly_transcript_08354.p1  ORF type:complete len:428 (+),score=37.73 Phypoly_transcript_08354:126-1409(+)